MLDVFTKRDGHGDEALSEDETEWSRLFPRSIASTQASASTSVGCAGFGRSKHGATSPTAMSCPRERRAQRALDGHPEQASGDCSEGIVPTVRFELKAEDATPTVDPGALALGRGCGW